jgi:hypothetical protein
VKRKTPTLVLFLALAIALSSLGGVFAACEQITAPVHTGFVFVDGDYLTPPYRVEVLKGNVLVNGHVLRELPHVAQEPAPVPQAEPPQDPQSAQDLLDVADAWLEDNDYDLDALTAYLESFLATAFVSESHGTVAITDRDGGEAFFLVSQTPPPILEDLEAEQASLAAAWRALLVDGGVLMTVPGGVLQVPRQDAQSFLRQLYIAFQGPEEERLPVLWGLLGSREAARALIEEGEMDDDLAERLAPPTEETPEDAAPSSVTVTRARPLAASHQQQPTAVADVADPSIAARTPRSRNAYIFAALGSPADYAAVVRAAAHHGYHIVLYERTAFQPGAATVANFYATSGQAGVLYAYAHGNGGALCLEQYAFKQDRDAAMREYLDSGYSGAVYATWTVSPGPDRAKSYVVCATDRGIGARWQDAQTIVHVHACDAFGLAAWFRAREFIAPYRSCGEPGPSAYSGGLWGRLQGTVDGGARRTVADAFQAAFRSTEGPLDLESLEQEAASLAPGFQHASAAQGRTVLSPTVASAAPRQSVSVSGPMESGEVVFDAPVALASEGPVVTGGGPCQPELLSISLLDDRRLHFSFVPRQPGMARFTVRADRVVSADNGVHLDGNQAPPAAGRVGPNGSDDYVWEVSCLTAADGPGTPAASPSPEV